jgi:hypothetical protein
MPVSGWMTSPIEAFLQHRRIRIFCIGAEFGIAGRGPGWARIVLGACCATTHGGNLHRCACCLGGLDRRRAGLLALAVPAAANMMASEAAAVVRMIFFMVGSSLWIVALLR